MTGDDKKADLEKTAFDPDFSPESEINQEAAKSRDLHYSWWSGQYVDEDGCPVRDKFGQLL
jgi:hypothetical protein